MYVGVVQVKCLVCTIDVPRGQGDFRNQNRIKNYRDKWTLSDKTKSEGKTTTVEN